MYTSSSGLDINGLPIDQAAPERPLFLLRGKLEKRALQDAVNSVLCPEISEILLEPAVVCKQGCHEAVYPNQEAITRMANAEKDGLIPAALLPKCPH